MAMAPIMDALGAFYILSGAAPRCRVVSRVMCGAEPVYKLWRPRQQRARSTGVS